jgi:hypothetical protein
LAYVEDVVVAAVDEDVTESMVVIEDDEEID